VVANHRGGGESLMVITTLQATIQFGLWAAADDVKHCLLFATLTLAGYAVDE